MLTPGNAESSRPSVATTSCPADKPEAFDVQMGGVADGADVPSWEGIKEASPAICRTLNKPDFTTDFWTNNIKTWAPLMEELEPKVVIEIGSFEGRSALWMLENIPSIEKIYCVDTWEGSEELHGWDIANSYSRFCRNLAGWEAKVREVHQPSNIGLRKLFDQQVKADLIYIDGSHTAPDCLTDAILAWPLLKIGGLMVFDDYLWRPSYVPGDSIVHAPKIAVDAFTTIFDEKMSILAVNNIYQIYVLKKAE